MRIFAALLLVLTTSCATIPLAPPNSSTPSLLISSKNHYNGKTVLVRGWMKSEFENYTLWDSQKAERQGQFAAACIGLLIPRSMNTNLLNNRYVVIEGIFKERLPPSTVFLGGCGGPVLQLDPNKPPIILGSG
jgi:hypothetical protein